MMCVVVLGKTFVCVANVEMSFSAQRDSEWGKFKLSSGTFFLQAFKGNA